MEGIQQVKDKCLGLMEKLLYNVPCPLQKSNYMGRTAFEGFMNLFVAACIKVKSLFLLVQGPSQTYSNRKILLQGVYIIYGQR